MRSAFRPASIVAVALAAAGCASAPVPRSFGLGAQSEAATSLRVPVRQVLIAEPTAVQPLDGDGMIVFTDGRYEMIAGSRWSDRLTRLVQERLVRGFEMRGLAVGRTGSGLSGDFVLGSDLKRFEILAGEVMIARVELTARVVEAQSGRMVAARSFRSDFPAASADPSEAVAALDRALEAMLPQVTGWAIASAR